jgi:tRNA threonylcarbamoyladenosine biosynthesis protein TsaE
VICPCYGYIYIPNSKTNVMDLGLHTLKTLKTAANKLLSLSDGVTVWCFEGEMGAGKTTFIKEVAKVLGVTEQVSSPTFSIVNEYRGIGNLPVYHFDLYRLNNLEEARAIGLTEYFYSGQFCMVEWPQMAESLLPDTYLKIGIESIDTDTRRISLKRVAV